MDFDRCRDDVASLVVKRGLHQHADTGQQAGNHVILTDYSPVGWQMSQALRTNKTVQYAETAMSFYPATVWSFAAFSAADTERSLTAIIAAINAMMALP